MAQFNLYCKVFENKSSNSYSWHILKKSVSATEIEDHLAENLAPLRDYRVTCITEVHVPVTKITKPIYKLDTKGIL